MKSNIAFSFYAVTRYIVIHRLSRGQGDKGVKKDLSPPKAATPEARRCGNERLDSVKVTVTGATGLIGSRLCGALRKRGDEVTAVAREWPPEVLARRDAVVHLAGERIAQRWSEEAMAMIRASRVEGAHRLVDALGEADPRPRVLVCASGADYYGDTGDRRVDESAPPGDSFLAQVCVEWEQEAARASELGLRVTSLRTGPVLARTGGALAKMLLPFRLGLGGRVGSGRQWFSWLPLDGN